MSKELEAAELLEKAADVLETGGWCQGMYHETRTGAHCAIGAVSAAGNVSPVLFDMYDGSCNYAVRALAQRLFKLDSSGFTSFSDYVVHWNDQKGRTAAEVIDTMKQTAKDLRNEAVPV